MKCADGLSLLRFEGGLTDIVLIVQLNKGWHFCQGQMEGLAARINAFEQGRIARRQITVVARARSMISLDVNRAGTGHNLRGLESNAASHARAETELQI